MFKTIPFILAATLVTTFGSSAAVADPKGKGDWESRKEQMKYEKEMRKKDRKYEREEAKKYREMEREEAKEKREYQREKRKHMEEMEREERKHRKEMEKDEREHEREKYEERGEREYDDDDRYDRDRDYRGESSTGSMQEEVTRQGRRWWEVWKSSE